MLRIGIIICTFAASLVAVALMLRLSHKKAWYDRINERKIHTGNIPRLGGAGFVPVFIIIAFIITFKFPEVHLGIRFLPVLLSFILILIAGVYDDFRALAPRHKLLIQIIAALCVVIPDYTFHRLFFFDIGFLSELNWMRYPLSFVWIVGLTNAINLLDGVDGLAGGISALIALSYAGILVILGNTGSAALLGICLTVAIGGFLVFNLPLPKAKIFMGDGGSQFLGFILALLPLIDKGGNGYSALPLPYAAALLIIPIFDTIAAIWRRIRDGRRIDSPDRFHVHHKLLNLGLSARGVDGVLYGLQLILGGLVFLSVTVQGVHSLVLLSTAYLVGIGFFSILHFMNRRVKTYADARA
ncbi:MAG: undecaprenyl/decaprenyl-phosphate alpha-N-acetylglucosaminyl 1-phosphate transferase [Treponema sp.]|jgi:UDP-GlcNAc:undecaprenyl-phosphate GlcNAc-1-phosphate transferase|nr:undecaprenyl/decaprenyl-phosphate alpha-N-acetylglucosaminyl 1-phosphate transferase [Treponema sp.]